MTICPNCVQMHQARELEVGVDSLAGPSDAPRYCRFCGNILNTRYTKDGIQYLICVNCEHEKAGAA